ncbi:MAG: hypothetical protein SOV77_09580 [Lachnospiraceae bacterium]|nr:hypothetical protein [Lachnospiraceae bacterium]MDY2614251.1 hypothetical protein [Lachnospiraceae bacterium]MDY4207777.1 hypothetical protein [Lachnospiraceae bacterium]
MKAYTDTAFYKNSYLLGREIQIPEKEFDYYAMLASVQIRHNTFDRIDNMDTIPEEVQMCCCEVAEKLYMVDAAKGENGLIQQSFGNDGETGTYKVDEMSEEAVQKSISCIIRKWLVNTGYMYCGVI